ncbi:MAG: 3-phosphoshikimate 1-carboxyvinyltransferase, partial [Mucilaginibacter sp.]
MKENIILSKKSKSASGTVQLTGSKSECNRALIIKALSGGTVTVENISNAADTETLWDILNGVKRNEQEKWLPALEWNVGPAGTAMRFLTAYFTLGDKEVILTGSERMKQRPIGILVNALREIGADIQYAENDGFPPLKIKGGFEQKKDTISIKGDISSQYITALLLIASQLPLGVTLQIEGELTS